MQEDFQIQSSLVSTAIMRETYTKSKASQRVRILKHYLETYYFDRRFHDNPAAIADYIIEKDSIDRPDDQKFVRDIGIEYISLFNRKSFYDVLSAVKNDISKSPRLMLYISAPLDFEAEKKICLWCREHINPSILLGIRYTHTITAGCGLSWQMKYYELSFETRFSQEKNKIISLINNYAAAATVQRS